MVSIHRKSRRDTATSIAACARKIPHESAGECPLRPVELLMHKSSRELVRFFAERLTRAPFGFNRERSSGLAERAIELCSLASISR